MVFYRDLSGNRGLVLTHIYLLLGIAIPVWIWVILLINQPCGEKINRLVFNSFSRDNNNNYPPPQETIVNINRTEYYYHKYYLIIKHLGWITIGIGDSMVSKMINLSINENIIDNSTFVILSMV